MPANVWTRFAVGAVLTTGLIMGAAPVGSAQEPVGLFRFEGDTGDRWLTGCVGDDFADRLVAHAGFIYGGPAPVLCIDGYSLIAKRLGQ